MFLFGSDDLSINLSYAAVGSGWGGGTSHDTLSTSLFTQHAIIECD